MKKSPWMVVKEKFGDKASLVKAVEALASGDWALGRLSEDKGLERVSNKKLLHLHAVLTEVTEKHGTRAKLIDAIVAVENRAKDADYRNRFAGYPAPRLLDYYVSAQKRAQAVQA